MALRKIRDEEVQESSRQRTSGLVTMTRNAAVSPKKLLASRDNWSETSTV